MAATATGAWIRDKALQSGQSVHSGQPQLAWKTLLFSKLCIHSICCADLTSPAHSVSVLKGGWSS